MKTRKIVSIMILILAFTTISEVYATGNSSYKRTFRKDFKGTWINSEYSKYSELPWAKHEIVSDTEINSYQTESSEWVSKNTLRVDDRWVDEKGGYTYYRVYFEVSGGFMFSHELWRINKSKDTLEINWHRSSYPDEINPKSGYYLIYYRQE